jgi:hypothetical protein
MDILALIVATVALVLASVAFTRSGGVREVRGQLESLGSKAEGARDLAANAIDRLEDLVRGSDSSDPKGGTGSGQKAESEK